MKKSVFLGLLLLFSAQLIGQKVKFKKGDVIVDGVKWGGIETEIPGKKYTFSTLNGEEFVTITFDGIETGQYDGNGKAIEEKYIIVNFLGVGMNAFETQAVTRKQIVQWLVKTKVIEDGYFSEEQAMIFKEKYEDNVSQKYQASPTIIINN